MNPDIGGALVTMVGTRHSARCLTKTTILDHIRGADQLIETAAENYVDRILTLYEKGMNFNVKNKEGVAPIHPAAQNGHSGTIRLLASCGANLNAVTVDGQTALHKAAPDNEIISLIVSLGGDVLACDTEGCLPLHQMAMSGSKRAIDVLLKAEPGTVVAINRQNQTPLHLVCQKENRSCVRALLDAGAHSIAEDIHGLQPLQYAAKNGCASVIPLLLDAGSAVDATTRKLWRPIHYAAKEDMLTLSARYMLHRQIWTPPQ